jgi:hypothetical protein
MCVLSCKIVWPEMLGPFSKAINTRDAPSQQHASLVLDLASFLPLALETRWQRFHGGSFSPVRPCTYEFQ